MKKTKKKKEFKITNRKMQENDEEKKEKDGNVFQ